MTLQRFASKLFVSGTLLAAFIPAVGLAREHGGNSRGERSSPAGRSQGGSRNYAPPRSSGGSGGHAYVAPRSYGPGPSSYSRGYAAPRSYARPGYRGYYSGGVYLGYGAPYGYGYAPGYAYDPGYAYGPAPAPPVCAEGGYDQYGAWIPSPNCYSGPRYQAAPPAYNPNQQQYPAPQQNYDPNQQQYQTPQQNYDPRYNR